jgi:hypothetical protein
MKTYGGVKVQLHHSWPQPLYPQEKEPPIPIGEEVGWTPELVRALEEINRALPGIEPLPYSL